MSDFGASLEQREAVSRFIEDNYETAALAASKRVSWIAKNRSGALAPRFRVFIYWAQGFDSAPPVVKACLDHAKAYHAAHDLALVDDKNLSSFVDIPDGFREEVLSNKTFFSDYLRFELLSRYGGVWADATCLAAGRWTTHVKPLMKAGFFAFPKQPAGVISSWFLASEAGSYVSCLMRELLASYCCQRQGPDHYFAMHQMFRAAYVRDGRFRKIMKAVDAGELKPRHMNRMMLKAVDNTQFDSLYRGSFVHKLSWKHKPHQLNSKMLISGVARGEWLDLAMQDRQGIAG